ncbi:MAG: polyprenyl diphosphate synthase [Pseudomonadota bacterium]
MDGNGRWAAARGLPRAAGHREGVEALRRTVEACRDLNLDHLTVFSFSTENWRRPPAEVAALFDLLRLYVKRDLKRLVQEGVRIRVLGAREGLSDDIVTLINDAETQSKHNTSFNLNIAFNYGGRGEIVEAARGVAQAVAEGKMSPEDVTEDALGRFMWTADLPDPDLVLRTSGELRISNFLLWGAAYSELMFMDVWWPDFSQAHLEQAIDAFRRRDRRYGGA